jgi:hypothetical protein
MGHTHDNEETEYYLDQLCSIALAGAFAGVCITLYTWQRGILNLILAEYFHIYVLWGGIALLAIVLIRAVTLWISIGKTASAVNHNHTHHHEHDHNHGHDHAHCHDHDHDHDHGHCHDHEHTHEHGAVSAGHSHNHDHGHEHSWAPWRYVVLLLPIMLYVLQLPNQGFGTGDLKGLDLTADPTEEAVGYARLIGPTINWAALAQFQGHTGPARTVDFLTLEQAASTQELRDDWRGKYVSVIGIPKPNPSSDRTFTLARYKITCCGADAVPLKVGIICRERAVLPQDPGKWVKVTGQIDFQDMRDGTFVTVLRVPSTRNIVEREPDANPYVQ